MHHVTENLKHAKEKKNKNTNLVKNKAVIYNYDWKVFILKEKNNICEWILKQVVDNFVNFIK